MQPSLRDIQVAFAAHLAGHDQHALVSAVVGGHFAARRRLQIHRRHFQLTLEAALASTFPTVAALVGATFFRRFVQGFVAGAPPADPVLSRYGDSFCQFIAEREADHGLPYLADVARLDWALNVAFHAPLEPRLSATDLVVWPQDSLSKLSVRLPAGSSLIESAYPLDLIWQASQPGTSVDQVDLAAGPACLVVFRRCEDAAFAVLTPAEAAFIEGLSRGDHLAAAAQHGSRVAEGFDLAATFGRMLGLRLLVAGTPA